MGTLVKIVEYVKKKRYFQNFIFKNTDDFITWKDADPCENNGCENDALCIPNSDGKGFTCNCKAGFYGDFCQFGTLYFSLKVY